MMTYSLAPSPKWYFADAQGRPAAGGFMYTYSATDHSTPKFIFSDPAGANPYDNPMILDASGGTKCPMYWDVTDPGLYYLVVTDSSGNIICTVDKFPLIGSGGVTPINNNVDIENHLVNGQFLFIDAINETDSIVTPIPQGETHLAQGSGFFKNIDGAYVSSITPGITAGWSFIKDGGVGATDTVRFQPVSTLGAGFPLEPSANATRYFEFNLSAIGTAYIDGALRNVIPNVELFAGETLTISFDTKGDSPAPASFEITQHFGTGGSPSADVTTAAAYTFNSGDWARQSFHFNVPTIVGKNKGLNQDDCLIIRWQMPLGVIGTFRLANLQVQRGQFGLENYIEQTYAQDQYKVLIDLLTTGNLLFQTGDYRWSDNIIARSGWLLLFNNAQTLGKTSASTATSFGTEYKNLYVLWWALFPQSECIVNGGRGVSAIADFNADKKMSIPQNLVNYVFAVAGNSIPFGTFEGERDVTLNATQLGSHTHGIRAISGAFAGGSGSITVLDGGGAVLENTEPSAGSAAHNNMQPTTYKYLFVKL